MLGLEADKVTLALCPAAGAEVELLAELLLDTAAKHPDLGVGI